LKLPPPQIKQTPITLPDAPWPKKEKHKEAKKILVADIEKFLAMSSASKGEEIYS
jgi:hypothetical protein